MRALLLVSLLVLAGCASPVETQPMPELSWGPMELTTTATEPFEYRGFIRIDWGTAFAVETENEFDMPRHLVKGDDVYVSTHGMGWTRLAPSDPSLSTRVVLWDLRLLLEQGTIDLDGDAFTATGTIGAIQYTVDGTLDGGRVAQAIVTSPQGRESPFTLVAGGPGVTYPDAPAESLSKGEAGAGSSDARNGHAVLVGLVNDHLERRGTIPDSVDPESLQAEMIVASASWPTNPFTGAPMTHGEASGHFFWTKCGPAKGSYAGYAWDGPILTQSYGGGCSQEERHAKAI